MSNMPKKKIAVTGTIGSGKSTVTKLLSNYYPTESSDRIVSSLYEDKEFVKSVNLLVLNEVSDVLNKQTLADAIFSDESLKESLEDFIHPLVKERVIDFLDKQEQTSVVEVPLLFEANFDPLFDLIITVVSDETLSKQRLMKYRNFKLEDIEARMKQQWSREEKSKNADYIIINDGTLEELELKVKQIVNEIEEVD